MRNNTSGRNLIRLLSLIFLVFILFFSCSSNAVEPVASRAAYGDKNIPLLLLTDLNSELAGFAASLTDEGWLISRMTQESFLNADEYSDLSEYGAVIVYIHQPLHTLVEEALISYTESGGKLLALHHSAASAKIENPAWLKFLGMSILPGDRMHPWKVSSSTVHTMVNLAPGHYLTSHKVEYDRKIPFSCATRPDLEGVYPAFDLADTEIFHNQLLQKDDDRVLLFGCRSQESEDGIPVMEASSGWYKAAGKGWLFYFQPGHSDADFADPSYFQVILNCLEWQPNNPAFASWGLEEPGYATADLNIGETSLIKLSDGSTAEIRLEEIRYSADSYRRAVREAEVRVLVNGDEIVLGSGMYNLPRRVSGLQIDCPVAFPWVHNRNGSLFNPWSLQSDARFRIWPGDSAWIDPGSFSYPVDAAWFSSDTQMTNDPCYVDHSDVPQDPGESGGNVYYHYGLDVGGCEGLTVIRSAIDGLVVSAADRTLPDYLKNTPVAPRYDVIYIMDSRGWFYRNSHLYSIEPDIRPGLRVRKGQKIGILGKEGGSGGWSHFHFDINRRQPSGEFGSEDGYAFYWQSYFASHPASLQAVARPHRTLQAGEEILLDGTRSCLPSGQKAGLNYQWTLSDGSISEGPSVVKKYDSAGYYSEILKVEDDTGNIDYDFCPVYVIEPGAGAPQQPPTIHASFHPTIGIRPGDKVTFKVRSFSIDPREGAETWNFGDGSPAVKVRSDGNSEIHNPEGYAVTTHAFREPGCYLVSVSRSDQAGREATTRLQVVVE